MDYAFTRLPAGARKRPCYPDLSAPVAQRRERAFDGEMMSRLEGPLHTQSVQRSQNRSASDSPSDRKSGKLRCPIKTMKRSTERQRMLAGELYDPFDPD